ncbi:hypothetical protein BV898_06421 [Hypsibius exemplaris]|uniref:Uncharacterized protein n=1 Tax=Hypsibius exemplaris TaxID=2072580 RepID=A0A1W0WWT4_HYPEX|nr:hypothetical protein BV898_06421 [Hypsibius exemplaris]
MFLRRSLFIFWHLALLWNPHSCDLFGSQLLFAPIKCLFHKDVDLGGSPSNRTACYKGNWPTNSDVAPDIPAETTALELSKVAFRDHPSLHRILPVLRSLNRLSLDGIISVDTAGNSKAVQFPLKKFTQNLRKEGIQVLYLRSVMLVHLEADDFAGFSGLQALGLEGCQLRTIDPRSFQHFASTFVRLVVTKNQDLKKFPWEALLPVSESIQVLQISHNPNLTKLDFSTEEATVRAVSMKLRNLTSLLVTYTGLSTLPSRVLHTLRPDGVNLNFMQNDNVCSQCRDVSSLLKWIRGKRFDMASSGESFLTLSCINYYPGNRFNAGNGDYWRKTAYCSVPTTVSPISRSWLVPLDVLLLMFTVISLKMLSTSETIPPAEWEAIERGALLFFISHYEVQSKFLLFPVWMRLIVLVWNEKACAARPWQSVLQLRIPASPTDQGSSTVAVIVPENGTRASAITQSLSSSPYTTAISHPVVSSSSSNTIPNSELTQIPTV